MWCSARRGRPAAAPVRCLALRRSVRRAGGLRFWSKVQAAWRQGMPVLPQQPMTRVLGLGKVMH